MRIIIIILIITLSTKDKESKHFGRNVRQLQDKLCTAVPSLMDRERTMKGKIDLGVT